MVILYASFLPNYFFIKPKKNKSHFTKNIVHSINTISPVEKDFSNNFCLTERHIRVISSNEFREKCKIGYSYTLESWLILCVANFVTFTSLNWKQQAIEIFLMKVHLHVLIILAVAQRCSVKKIFLEISQNSQEDICAKIWQGLNSFMMEASII